MTRPIFVLNGPNLNRLGTREPHIYGSQTLDDIRALCEERARAFNHDIDFRQTNSEGELVNWVQEAADGAAGVIINPAGYTTTSVALHDALKLVAAPVVEIHLSQTAAREPFRHNSLIAPIATGTISGLGVQSYTLAIEAVCRLVAES